MQQSRAELIFPEFVQEITPNADLPVEIKSDFLEASKILQYSPRGSAALLRLCIQKLCAHFGGGGKNINDDIGLLVQKGLDKRIQRALDIVRVIGNEAVHPGQINLTDDTATAKKLFQLVNIIADNMITQTKQIDDLYDGLPEEKRKQIENRDK